MTGSSLRLFLVRAMVTLSALVAGVVCSWFVKQTNPQLSSLRAETPKPPQPATIEIPPLPKPGIYSVVLAEYLEDRMASGISYRLEAAIFNISPSGLLPTFEELRSSGFIADHTILRALFGRWAEVDPVAALEAAALLRRPHLRLIAHYAVWGVWAATDPESGLKHLSGPLNKIDEQQATLHFWTELATASPERALTFAAAISDDQERTDRENEINRLHAYRDPEAALAWALNNRSGEEANKLTAGVFWPWALSDPPAALHALLALPEDLQTDAAFSKLGGGATRRSVNDALQLLPNIPESRQAAFLGEAVHQEVFNNINPLGAVALAASIPPGNIRDRAHYRLASEWARLDATQASTWVASLAPSESRDHAASAISHHLRSTDPEAATVWGTFIDDPSMRADHAHKAAREWLKADPEAATAWLHATDRLNQDQKAPLLSPGETD